MPVTFTRITGPFGSDVFFSKGMAAVGYRVVGDGVGGAINLPFHKLESVISVDSPPYDPTPNNTTKVVALTVPAALANGDFVDVWLYGKGGH